MKTTDPVCGMSIESTKAAAHETFHDKTYYFCSTQCRDDFKKAPQKYVGAKAKDEGCCGGSHRSHRH